MVFVYQPGKGLSNVKVIGEINGRPRDRIDEAGVEHTADPGAAPHGIRLAREEGA